MGRVKMKTWRIWEHDDCLYCGGDVEVFTDAPDGYLTEDDEARCSACNCPGIVTLTDGDDEVGYFTFFSINWHDEPDCDCEWCQSHPA